MMTDDQERAIEAFERALAINPDHTASAEKLDEVRKQLREEE